MTAACCGRADMSFDLFAWKTPAVADEAEAAPLIKRYVDTGDDRGFGASSDVASFYDELSRKYPPPEPGTSATPRRDRDRWGIELEPSDRLLVVSMTWNTPDEVLDDVVALARKHGLVLFDPQGPTLHAPEGAPAPDDVAAQVRQALAGGAFGALLVLVGVYIPWRILSWPAIAIGSFLVVMALYTFGVLWSARRGGDG